MLPATAASTPSVFAGPPEAAETEPLVGRRVIRDLRRSQVLFGEFAKFVGNGTGQAQSHRPVSDSIPAETIADLIDGAVRRPTRHASHGTRSACLVFESKREFKLHIPVLLEVR